MFCDKVKLPSMGEFFHPPLMVSPSNRRKVKLPSAQEEIMIHFESFTLIGTRIAF